MHPDLQMPHYHIMRRYICQVVFCILKLFFALVDSFHPDIGKQDPPDAIRVQLVCRESQSPGVMASYQSERRVDRSFPGIPGNTAPEPGKAACFGVSSALPNATLLPGTGVAKMQLRFFPENLPIPFRCVIIHTSGGLPGI